MTMKKRLLAALLCACLLLTPALAAGSFPAVNAYTPGYYHDVTDGAWYAAAAKLCYETGLMTGTAANTFAPDKTLTIGECAAVAARIWVTLSGKNYIAAPPEPFQAKPWYTDYMATIGNADPDLAPELSPLWERPTDPITRGEFFLLTRAALSAQEDLLTPINSITALPDTDDANILSFYNAGILTGTDAYGTFSGSKSLTRAECATMVARIVDSSLRQAFTPQVKADKPALSYEEELMQTEAVRINGVSVNFAQFIQTLNTCVAEVDASLKSSSGKGLDWNAKYSWANDLPAYFKQMALSRLVESAVVTTQARARGCTVEALPASLTPDPSQALSNIYCAKHILVDDEATANTIIATLRAQVKSYSGLPKDLALSKALADFDALLAQYGTDPGMTSNPNGYLFTDGDMVTEFENAVKALKIGSCSSVPVKSQFGYHVILRLDPTSYPGWEQEVREMRYNSYVEQWMASSTVTRNSAELDRLDVPARYAAYVASQGG